MPTIIKTKIEELKEQPLAPIGDEAAIAPLFEPIQPDDKWLSPPLVRLPSHIKLGALRDGRLRVVSPISVNLSTEEQQVIAEAVELNEFGFGANPSEAIMDLQHAIAELYFTLEEEQDRLGKDLLQTWARLQQKICKR